MPEPQVDYRTAFRLLTDSKVRFVVVGGVAMHLHGASNLTLDVDISYDRAPENLQALANALSGQHPRLRGAPPGLPFVFDARTLRNALNITLETDIGDFDILAVPDGVDSFDGLWERAEPMDLNGLLVRVASVDDLVAMKRAADRLKDRTHIQLLEAIKQVKSDGSA